MTSEFYEDEKITEHEKEISSKQAIVRLLPFLKSHKRALTLCLILLAISQVISVYWPTMIKDAVDSSIADGNYPELLTTALYIGLLQVISIVLLYWQRIRLEIVGQDLMVSLKSKLFDHVLSLDISFFDKNPVGRLMARIESDTEAMRQFFTNTSVIIVGDMLLVGGIFGVMLYHSWQLALILFSIIPVVFICVYIFEKITTPRFLEVRKKMAEVTATITELLQGMSIIQIFHRADYASKRVYVTNELKFNDDRFVNVAVIIFFNTVFFVQYVMIAVVLFFGLYWRADGSISTGTILMFLILIFKMFEPIWRISEQLSTIQKAIAGSKRVFALLSRESRLPKTKSPVTWPGLDGSIKFENVWFSYTDNEDWILKDISFEIKKGQRFALVGVTGGGKTSVISLLLRYYDPQRGKITVDGIDIKNLTNKELRSKFALVLQDIFLFPGTVHSNIALESDSISDEQVHQSADMVEATGFIDRLPKGYKTEVSEKGSNFSRGERQLLSFARALATNPDVLLLDEATSSVDPETERTIQASLKKLMSGRTSLIIAHRLSTILDVDQILVIKRGEIVEQGTHLELILQKGYYSKLFHLQFKQKNGVLNNVG